MSTMPLATELPGFTGARWDPTYPPNLRLSSMNWLDNGPNGAPFASCTWFWRFRGPHIDWNTTLRLKARPRLGRFPTFFFLTTSAEGPSILSHRSAVDFPQFRVGGCPAFFFPGYFLTVNLRPFVFTQFERLVNFFGLCGLSSPNAVIQPLVSPSRDLVFSVYLKFEAYVVFERHVREG